jgi:hypothetical protein
MKPMTRRILFWLPRGLCLAFALFISLFALDVFGEGYGFWGTVWAFLMHMIPTALVLIALVVAWRWEWVGAVLFAGLAVFYCVVFRRNLDWIIFLLIPGPLLLVALLFLVNWLRRDELRSAAG